MEKGFTFRVKFGDCEIEICGNREEVLKTIEELPNLLSYVNYAFETLKPKTVATLTVKRESAKEEASLQKFPKIVHTEKCDEAVLRILESEWGKWRPRTFTEIVDALKANNLNFSGRVLSAVLLGLVKKGMIRRWKTDAGYVYILAEKEAVIK